jgi:hypothetical protein
MLVPGAAADDMDIPVRMIDVMGIVESRSVSK